MNFNNTIRKISLLTFIFLSWFSEAGTTVIAEVENTHAIPDNILLSPKNLETAQNETVATGNLETEIIAQINLDCRHLLQCIYITIDDLS